ncbi:ATP-binding cassette domain-containing protein [Demequina capsici]|uniref:ATP-binding cassette domain-containing protein n=1 Tax=Demequina capsici TaxID=3075620 RepID=A0AA96F9W2_9MICO|nr:ATP-binding cassette domain-containing protein [Demequina sp. OYTSA14]WNM24290.1 ATP-binding cassette domain-containing protein [Demequina sp. OYTSA14]
MSVTLTGVGHRFGNGPWLFREVATALDPGHVYALTGPSGSGKSTMLGLLAGWMEPSEGTVGRAAGLRIGWVPQNPHGVARRTVIDHVELPLLAAGAAADKAYDEAMELLERFQIPHLAAQQFRSISGGEAQRLMLARGIAAKPGLLLVDEPTAQLDRRTAATVDAVIGRLAESGTVVVVATHDAQTRDGCTDVLNLEDWAA